MNTYYENNLITVKVVFFYYTQSKQHFHFSLISVQKCKLTFSTSNYREGLMNFSSIIQIIRLHCEIC